MAEQNKCQTLLRELLEAQRNRKSEQLSKEQLALFEAAWQARSADAESAVGENDDDLDGDPGAGPKPDETSKRKRGGRQPLARHLRHERIVHDLAETEKHCHGCGKDLRLIAEETSETLRIPEKMFERHGIDISRKTMGGWVAQCAELLDPVYQLMKKELLSSKVIGADDTSVKVLDRKLSFARIGRIWPYVGDAHRRATCSRASRRTPSRG